jgi:O-antigen/teichoic acid export membrane protein
MNTLIAFFTRIRCKLINLNNNIDNKEILSSAAIIFAVKVLMALMAFFVSIVITRFLTVEEAGYYFFILSVVVMLSTVSRVGLDNAIVRFMAVANERHDLHQLKRVFCLSIWLALGGASLILLLLGLAAQLDMPWLIHGDYSDSLLWMMLIIPVVSLTVVFIQSFQGIKHIALFAGFNGLIRPLNLCALTGVLLISGGLSISQALWVYLFVAVVVLLLAYLSWRYVLQNKQYVDHSSKLVGGFDRQFYSYSFSVWGIACLAIVMGQGAQVLLGVFSTAEQAAYFAVANRIALLVSFVLLAINGILSPKFAEISEVQDTARLQSVYRASTGLMIVLTSPFLLLIFIFSPEVLLLFGTDYQQAATVLRVLIGAQFVRVMVGSVGQLLIMANLQRHQRNNLILSVVILLGMSVCLMPTYGALGAAIACFFAITCNNMLGLFQVYKKLNIRMF